MLCYVQAALVLIVSEAVIIDECHAEIDLCH